MEQKLVEEIEQTCLRLHTYILRLEQENRGFADLTNKTSKKGISIFRWKDKCWWRFGENIFTILGKWWPTCLFYQLMAILKSRI